MELWDIYDSDKKRTGRTMKRNDWNLKNGEYHLTVLGVIHRPDGRPERCCRSGGSRRSHGEECGSGNRRWAYPQHKYGTGAERWGSGA